MIRRELDRWLEHMRATNDETKKRLYDEYYEHAWRAYLRLRDHCDGMQINGRDATPIDMLNLEEMLRPLSEEEWLDMLRNTR